MVFFFFLFPPKNERKQVDLRYHSSRVEFFHCFFEDIEDTKNNFKIIWPLYWRNILWKYKDIKDTNRNTTSKLISKHYELSSFTSKQSKIAVLATYQSGNSWEWNMGEFKKREKIALVSIFVFISIVVFDSYTYSNQTKLDQIKW